MNPRVNDSIVYACGTVLFIIKLAVAVVVAIWSFTTSRFALGALCVALSFTGFFGARGMFRKFKTAKEEESALSGIPAIKYSKKNSEANPQSPQHNALALTGIAHVTPPNMAPYFQRSGSHARQACLI